MKKEMYGLVFLIMVIMSLTSCSKGKKDYVTFLGEYVCGNVLEGGDEFGFSLSYLYQGEKPDLEFVKFDDAVATEKIKTFRDATDEGMEGKQYQGYQFGTVRFQLDISDLKSGDCLEIRSVTLLINGQEKTADIPEGILLIKHDTDEECYRTESVYFTRIPFQTFSCGDAFERAPFYYHAKKDITIEGFEFSDFLEIKDSVVLVDGKVVGSMESVLPLTINAEQDFGLEISGDYGKYDPFSVFYVSCLMHYSDKDGKRIFKTPMTVKAVTDYEDFTAFVDHFLDEKKRRD